MITFPKFESFTPDQQKFIKDSLISVKRFDENLKKVNEISFAEAFGNQEGKRLWEQYQISKLTLAEFGKRQFSESQKKEMVEYIKNMD